MRHVWERRKCIFYKVMIGEHEERDRLEDAGVVRVMILNYTVKIHGRRARTKFICLRTVPSSGLL
jgi:hypothetical protein